MGKEAYSKYRLTVDEHNVLQKLSRVTKADAWFAIAGSDVFLDNGEIAHKSRCNGMYDEIYDEENGRYISLRSGVGMLNEAFESTEEINSSRLSPKERRIYGRLLEKLKIV